MHTLHTTEAFILDSYEHGETSRVYKLFTKEKGMLFAHGQGVREVKNKNRYALRTHALMEVTLVRGREVWRITSAREKTADAPQEFRNVLHFIGSIIPREVSERELFIDLAALQEVMHSMPHVHDVAERIGVLRGMMLLGYVDKNEVPVSCAGMFAYGTYTPELCDAVAQEYAVFAQFVNMLFSRV